MTIEVEYIIGKSSDEKGNLAQKTLDRSRISVRRSNSDYDKQRERDQIRQKPRIP